MRKSEAQLNAEALARREALFVTLAVESKARLAREPRTFVELLTWFLEGWSAEMPDAIHAAGVWRAKAARVDKHGIPLEVIPSEQVGGSLLGTPKDAEPFRQLVENSPFQTGRTNPADYEGSDVPYYLRPMRAALAKMAGDGSPARPGPLMARNLERLARSGGDWRAVAIDENCYDAHFAEIYWHEALRRLRYAWRAEPPAKIIPKTAA